MTPHPVHLCLGCGSDILPDQDEVAVTMRRGLPKVRYRHASDGDCQDGLRLAVNRAQIGSYRDNHRGLARR